jgi:hypothetical protein
MRSKRWNGQASDGIYQITEFSDKRLHKTGVRFECAIGFA